jgi:hypothetical protein
VKPSVEEIAAQAQQGCPDVVRRLARGLLRLGVSVV